MRSLCIPEGCNALLLEGTREEWLEARRKGVGSSDIAALLQLSPWATPFHVWLSKVGEDPDYGGDAKKKEWGLRLEDVVARAYEEETGVGLALPPAQILQSKQYPFLLASLDRVWEGGGCHPVELKTSAEGHGFGESQTDQVPDNYLLQVQFQLAVTGADAIDLAVLIGLADFRVYHIPRNEKIIGKLIDVCRDFWKLVETRKPPEPSWEHAETLPLIQSMYAVEPTLQVQLDQASVELVNEYEQASINFNGSKRIKEALKAKLLNSMGSAGTAYLPDGTRLYRKTVTVKPFENPGTEYVRLTIKRSQP